LFDGRSLSIDGFKPDHSRFMLNAAFRANRVKIDSATVIRQQMNQYWIQTYQRLNNPGYKGKDNRKTVHQHTGIKPPSSIIWGPNCNDPPDKTAGKLDCISGEQDL
jgi:hypothetical protein